MQNKRQFINLGDAKQGLLELQNDTNNAVANLYHKPKQISQQGKLLNATLTIKDVFATDDLPTQASSKLLENFNPRYNATVVQKLLNEGAIALGKVHNDELALGGTGTHSGFGIIKNPLDNKRFAGGSSSGSVATFTKNIGIALGSDTGDSVRLPASYNGVLGFKPSYGAISRYGMFAYASSLDTVAYFAHNVNDLILISQSVYGIDEKDMTSKEVQIENVSKTKPNKVIALDFSEFVSDYVQERFNQFLNLLRKKEIEVEVQKPNIEILRAIKPVYQIISFSEASSNLSNLNGVAFGNRVNADSWEEIMKQTRSKKFGKMVQERLSLGSYFLYQENQLEIFIKAQKARRVIKDYLNKLHESGDVLIYPAYGGVAPLFENPANYGVMDYILTGSNLAGNPSLTLPFGMFENLPFSLAIDAKIYEDAKLLGIAEYFEELIKGDLND